MTLLFTSSWKQKKNENADQQNDIGWVGQKLPTWWFGRSVPKDRVELRVSMVYLTDHLSRSDRQNRGFFWRFESVSVEVEGESSAAEIQSLFFQLVIWLQAQNKQYSSIVQTFFISKPYCAYCTHEDCEGDACFFENFSCQRAAPRTQSRPRSRPHTLAPGKCDRKRYVEERKDVSHKHTAHHSRGCARFYSSLSHSLARSLSLHRYF